MTASRRAMCSAAMVFVVLAFGLAGCTSPRNALGTNSSPCFRALAAAPQAVDHMGRYAGVRYLSSSVLESAIRKASNEGDGLPEEVATNKAPVCVVEYSGTFRAGELSREWPSQRTKGRFAVVVLVAKTDRLLATILFDRQAVRFTKEL